MYALDVVCFNQPFRFNHKAMRRFATRAGAIVLVAEVEAAGELAGFAIVQMERGGLAYVVTLDVAPRFRRQGLASALMAQSEMQASSAGAERMGLHVFTANIEAIAFYERHGYERRDLVRDFYGERLDAFVYLKQLAD